MLLQLLMWYLVFADVLPPPQTAWNVADLFFLSKGGFSFPVAGVGARARPGWAPGLLVGLAVGWWWRRRAQRQLRADRPRPQPLGRAGRRGDRPGLRRLGRSAARRRSWSVPEQLASWSTAASALTPEFLAVLVGLVMYTAAFIAEVVRGGIQSVQPGQTRPRARSA